ncbi:hypothetical protein Celaphus_00008816, partial [Cervus elaphus hippelaphus]
TMYMVAGNVLIIMTIIANKILKLPMHFCLACLSNGIFQAILTFHLTFCRSNIINHFYCADPPLIMLACSQTQVKELALLISASFNHCNSFIIILITSAEGRHKAFFSCGSHITVETVYYGAIFCTYLRSPTGKNAEGSKIIAVFYTFVIPVLNPLIYSLRNNDVKQALKRVLQRNMVTK